MNSARTWLLTIAGITVGALSHIGLDLLTHPDSILVQHVPFFSIPLLTTSVGTIRLYFFLQYFFSTLGLALMIWWYARWYRRADSITRMVPHRFGLSRKIGIGVSIGSFTCLGGLAWGLATTARFPVLGFSEMAKQLITSSAIAATSSFIVALLTFGIIWHVIIPRHKRVKIIDSALSVINKEIARLEHKHAPEPRDS